MAVQRGRVRHPSSLMQEEETYAKQQLGVPAKKNGKLLGFDWNKEDDPISISFPTEKADLTKRGILFKVARVYDPLVNMHNSTRTNEYAVMLISLRYCGSINI